MKTDDHSKSLDEREQYLRTIIRQAAGDKGRVVVAFSGGVDSSLLLWECVQELGKHGPIAVTAVSPTSFPGEEQEARMFAGKLGVEHHVVQSQECSDPRFMANPEDRCYVCKGIRYGFLGSMGTTKGITILDGTQADDDPADRPGMRALKEQGILTPLAEAGLGKQDVRRLLERAGYAELAEKLAQPCLATRLPFGHPITIDALEMIGQAEAVLRSCGLKLVRVRHHPPIARIVTDLHGISLVISTDGLRNRIVEKLREIGYAHVTLDLEEYGTWEKNAPNKHSEDGTIHNRD